jgi:HK97 family phage prohead protease
MLKYNDGKQLKRKMVFETKAIDEENFIIRGVFSTGDVDRQGEVIDQTGWKLDEFKSNPVVLFAHDHYQPAVAQVMEIGVDAAGQLAGAIKFAAKEYDFAATLFKLYAGKYMRAFSVGFMNNRYEIDQENDIVYLKENTMYELSCVNVPANAMALAYAKGIDTEPVKKWLDEMRSKRQAELERLKDGVVDAELIKTLSSDIRALTEAIESGNKADNKVVAKVEHPAAQTAGGKKIPVKLINKTMRELLKLKNTTNQKC